MRVLAFLLFASQATCFTSFPRKNRLTSSLSMSAALIVQNKGGGHGELGFQLAKNLSSNPKITSITILQDDACKDSTEPFKSYQSDLPDVKVVKVSLGDEAINAASIKNALEGQSFDYIWDNASKGSVGAGKAIIDCAKEWNCKLLTYVSSAGCYQPAADSAMPMSEANTPAKESSGQVQYENYATEQSLPFVSFRPQYIYGPKSNKYDYIDWYFDRIMRELPLPIPGDGNQKVSLTNSEDVASLLASVLNDEATAVKQRIFNCGTDNLISYNEVAELCAEIAGKKATIHLYDGESLGKGKFPFRLTDFYVAPDLAKEKLGWTGAKHTLKEDLPWYFENYQARGGDTKDLDLEKDQEILSSC